MQQCALKMPHEQMPTQSSRRLPVKALHLQAQLDACSLSTRVVQKHAEAGDVGAQVELARRLSRQRKQKEALTWFRKAARSGQAEAQMELGLVLFWEHDRYRNGMQWIQRAADQGLVGAQYFLGAELAVGDNVRKDLRKALRWYKRAAAQGHSEAQYNLAMMYWAGEGVRASISTAHRWLETAASRGDPVAIKLLVDAHEEGTFGYRRNKAKAGKWRRRSDGISKASRQP